jgi:hypothetical protein
VLEEELEALPRDAFGWPRGRPELLVDAVLARRNDELRRRFSTSCVRGAAGGLTVSRDEDLPWERWNSLERRLQAVPAPATA